jgi:REP element-mobilizing transposase RayT
VEARREGGDEMRRFNCDTANWHVFARGTRRLRLFRDKQDYTRFLNNLTYALKRSGCVLWAFALMSNHYHLVLRGSSAQLTSCMRRLNMMYSRYHNKRYALDGHTFDGPYQAFRQSTPLLMLHTIAYVFFNPVKGGLCARPEDYPWSCCRCYLNLIGSPLEVDAAALAASIDPDIQRAWTRFHQAMEQQARRPAKTTVRRPTMIELHQEQFEWLVEHANAVSDRLQGESPTLVAMHWARQIGVTPKAIARVLGKSNTGSTRFQLCMFNKRLEADPKLKERLALR